MPTDDAILSIEILYNSGRRISIRAGDLEKMRAAAEMAESLERVKNFVKDYSWLAM